MTPTPGQSENISTFSSVTSAQLDALLHDLISELGVTRACFVAESRAARCAERGPDGTVHLETRADYAPAEGEVEAQVRSGGRPVGKLYVSPLEDESPNMATLKAFALAAGYLLTADGVSPAPKSEETAPGLATGGAGNSSAGKVSEGSSDSEQSDPDAASSRRNADREYIEKIFEYIPGALLVLEPPEYRVVRVNSQVRRSLPEPYRSGAPVEGITVRALLDGLGRSERLAETLALFDRVLETGQPYSVSQVLRQNYDGAPSYWDWTAAPLADGEDGERPSLILIGHNVDNMVLARQEAERAANAESARAEELEAVINQMADGITLYDADGRVQKINPAGQRLLGRGIVPNVEPKDYVEQYGLMQLNGIAFPPEQLPYRRALRGEVVVGEQLSVVRPDGTEVVVSISASPVRDKQGNIKGAVSVFHDVTKEVMVDRLKDDFLAIVSHELRTPPTAIIGYIDLMLRGVYGGLSDRQAKALAAARDNAARLNELINNLLDVSKLESGVESLELKTVDIVEVVTRSIALSRVIAAEAGVAIVNNLPRRDLPLVMADQASIQRVVDNLLTNATKFTPRGGSVTFDAELSPLHASDTSIGTGNMQSEGLEGEAVQSLIISVTDTGAGLERDQIQRIWDRFYQVDSTARRHAGGAGLGLAIVRRIIELHGGQVWAESAGQTRGSTFRFSVPVAPASLVQTESPRGRDSALPELKMPRPGQIGTVLVAEDDADQREIICDMLEIEGYNVVLAQDGEQALELARQTHPAAIILDVILPRADGWEVLKLLKTDASTAHIPVLIISVVDQPSFGKRLGADEYLLKPLQPQFLRSTLRKLVAFGPGNDGEGA